MQALELKIPPPVVALVLVAIMWLLSRAGPTLDLPSLLRVAGAALLASGWALLGPLAFVLYIGRFQIAPEERALSARFGADYAAYQSRVRRWF